MRKRIVLFLCSFALVSGSFAQKLSDQQVIQMAVQEKKSGASETEIATRLMQKGATMDQIQRIRSQYAQQITKRGMDDTVDNALGDWHLLVSASLVVISSTIRNFHSSLR